ncbi:MAG: hypothetical protein ACRCS3_11065 [Paracoccaceae bacterium]
MTECDVYAGANRPKEDLTLPYIWVSLHMAAEVHAKHCTNERFAGEIANLARSDLFLLDALSGVDADRWSGLCSSAGWTSYGAIALSWCRGATLKDVGRGLASAQALIEASPQFTRLADMLCPATIPQPLTLSTLTEACSNEYQAFCLVLARSQVQIVDDLPHEVLLNAPLAVQPFLNAVLGTPMVQMETELRDAR